ncbi:hypothetical protein GQ43DRAFT_373758 [Delitschia confertaspora ATCC 74209]|uniref:Zn(2)-C6 fungal-type domain-containing protein n=1 Tax=Delitschia confertaspora ATCC 74209 TaxID=1513339 RepID=A0A9P4JJW5_9PLEO|nr:hypothetical protein GQ43DRAFT_373758 [Delitschia confertaspora ATCC 74209]
MVYTGKPSRGCQTCKTRRIKCDEKRPICSQCKKSSRTCPGYMDEFDLVFRNETVVQERKAKKTCLSPKGGSQRSLSSLSESSSFEFVLEPSPPTHKETASSRRRTRRDLTTFQLVPSSPQTSSQAYVWKLANCLPPTLNTVPEVEATAFFFRNFVSLPRKADSMRGYLELLVPLYNRASSSSSLHLATTAVALAACGLYPGRQPLLREAASTYGKALRRVNEDLADPVMSKADETVLAILLFSLYETVSSPNKDSMMAWANHVDGAVALTKSRGDEQFKNPMSYAVFRAVRTMMITSCVQRSKPVESFPSRHGWIGDVEQQHEENVANRLTLICIDLPAIRVRATTLHNHPPRTEALIDEARSLIEFARMVDENLLIWSRTLSSDWQYQTATMVYNIPDDLHVSPEWPGPQHVYESMHIASIINDYRVCRIFCQSVIIACSTWLNPSEINPKITEDYIKSTYIIQQMVDDIAACVPYHMNSDMHVTSQQLGQDRTAAEALGGYFLVWPLYVAANAEGVSQMQKDWLQGRLFYIGMTFGLTSAQVLLLARRHVLTCGPMFP